MHVYVVPGYGMGYATLETHLPFWATTVHSSTDPTSMPQPNVTHTYLIPTDEGGQPREGLLARAPHADEEGAPARVGEDAGDARDVLHGLLCVCFVNI